MANTGTYLNFPRGTEEAFTFYKSVFGGDFQGPIMRHGDMPMDNSAALSEQDRQAIVNITLPILNGHLLMGSDIPEAMGMPLTQGNTVQIVLDPDTRAEADRLFAGLSGGGTVEDPMQEMFWGDYYGAATDRFGVRWIVNCTSKD
jgi:PhnB protein